MDCSPVHLERAVILQSNFNYNFFLVAGNAGGYCVLGKIPMESLYLSWENSRNLSLGQRVEVTFCVDLLPYLVKVLTLYNHSSSFMDVEGVNTYS